MKIAAVILAAGLSSRMGAFKPLISLGKTSLLGHCRNLFLAAHIPEILVVVGHSAEKTIAEVTSLNLRWVQNSDYHSGMFSSIQCAVTALPKDTDGFFVLPVDIPLIRPVTIRTLQATFHENAAPVLYPTFAGRRGHPPLISTALSPAIRNHKGVGGLDDLLRQYKGIDVVVWDEGIHIDADTPEDLQQLQQRLAHLSIPTHREAEALARLRLSAPGFAHGQMVGRVAVALAQALNDQGISLNTDLLYAAALLHDVAKGQPHHEIKGAEILSLLGLEKIAEIVASHKDLAVPPIAGLTEKEIVYLADKLISGTRRVQIEERYAEKLNLFNRNPQACLKILGRKARALAVKAVVENVAKRNIESILSEARL